MTIWSMIVVLGNGWKSRRHRALVPSERHDLAEVEKPDPNGPTWGRHSKHNVTSCQKYRNK